VHRPRPGLALNEHYVGHGDIVYRQACKLGCEGIVSKPLASTYRSGRSRHWLKVKNPAAPAVRREAEEDWGRLTTVGTTRMRLRLMFRYAPDNGAKANMAGLPPWATNRPRRILPRSPISLHSRKTTTRKIFALRRFVKGGLG
jgi:hypothetical protein